MSHTCQTPSSVGHVVFVVVIIVRIPSPVEQVPPCIVRVLYRYIMLCTCKHGKTTGVMRRRTKSLDTRAAHIYNITRFSIPLSRSVSSAQTPRRVDTVSFYTIYTRIIAKETMDPTMDIYNIVKICFNFLSIISSTNTWTVYESFH